jgi:large subunit ribosomal protein L30
MAKVRITQIKSKSGRPEEQRKTLTALGLRKTNHSVEKELNPSVSGMIAKVKHLLKVENI